MSQNDVLLVEERYSTRKSEIKRLEWEREEVGWGGANEYILI